MASSRPLGCLMALTPFLANTFALPSLNLQNLAVRDDEGRFTSSSGKDVWCPQSDWSKADERASLWYGSWSGEALDDWINDVDDGTNLDSSEGKIGKGGEWFKSMVIEVLGNEEDMLCGHIGQAGCTIKDCDKYYDQGPKKKFWILKQVEMFNAVLDHLRNKLVVESTLASILDIPELSEEFSEPDDGVDTAQIQSAVGAALGAFTAPLGLAGSAGAKAAAAGGMIGGIFGTMNAFRDAKEGDSVKKMYEAVDETFEATRNSLEDVLKNALGTGDQRELPGTALSGRDLYQTHTAKFFAEGKWMVKTDGEEVTTFVDRSSDWMKKALISIVLRQRGFEVYIWDDFSEDDCKSLQEDAPHKVRSARWIEDGDEPGCYFLSDDLHGHLLHDAWGPMKFNDHLPSDLEEEQLDLLTGKYGVDMADMYRSVLHCASTDEDSNTSIDLFAVDSDKKPRCLFDFKLKKVQWDEENEFETIKEDFKS